MFISHYTKRPLFFKLGILCILTGFLFSFVVPPEIVYAQNIGGLLGLPNPGQMVPLSPGFIPAVVRGIKIHPDNPLKFDFIIDSGDSNLKGEDLKDESEKLIRYFLSALTLPEDELWVNLSPYEKDRIIPNELGSTELGRDLLAQDYLLKQITASLIYPEDELGKKFWERVYREAFEKYGTTNIPVNTFNKVWIIPEKAVVYEQTDRAFVVEAKLKVMLEEDYLALANSEQRVADSQNKDLNIKDSTLTSDIIREIVIPKLEKEVNEGKNFAQLRQIYHSLILAAWFKNNLKNALLNKVYSDQRKIKGVDLSSKKVTNKIYRQYLEAFKKGVCDYIKIEYDQYTKKHIPRKYFSGGFSMQVSSAIEKIGDEKKHRSRKIKFIKNLAVAVLTLVMIHLALPSALEQRTIPVDIPSTEKFFDADTKEITEPIEEVKRPAAYIFWERPKINDRKYKEIAESRYLLTEKGRRFFYSRGIGINDYIYDYTYRTDARARFGDVRGNFTANLKERQANFEELSRRGFLTPAGQEAAKFVVSGISEGSEDFMTRFNLATDSIATGLKLQTLYDENFGAEFQKDGLQRFYEIYEDVYIFGLYQEEDDTLSSVRDSIIEVFQDISPDSDVYFAGHSGSKLLGIPNNTLAEMMGEYFPYNFNGEIHFLSCGFVRHAVTFAARLDQKFFGKPRIFATPIGRSWYGLNGYAEGGLLDVLYSKPHNLVFLDKTSELGRKRLKAIEGEDYTILELRDVPAPYQAPESPQEENRPSSFKEAMEKALRGQSQSQNADNNIVSSSIAKKVAMIATGALLIGSSFLSPVFPQDNSDIFSAGKIIQVDKDGEQVDFKAPPKTFNNAKDITGGLLSLLESALIQEPGSAESTKIWKKNNKSFQEAIELISKELRGESSPRQGIPDVVSISKINKILGKIDQIDSRAQKIQIALENLENIYIIGEYDKSKSTLVFLHGMGGDVFDAFGNIFDEVKSTHNILTFLYDDRSSLKETSDVFTEQLGKFSKQYGLEQYDIIAYSMGGLVTREGVMNGNFDRLPPCNNYYEIGTPLGGSALAGLSPSEDLVSFAFEKIDPSFFEISKELNPYFSKMIRMFSPEALENLNKKIKNVHIFNAEGDHHSYQYLKFLQNRQAYQVKGFQDRHEGALEAADNVTTIPEGVLANPHTDLPASQQVVKGIKESLMKNYPKNKVEQKDEISVGSSAATAKSFTRGGIDFNKDQMNIETKGEGVNFTLPQNFENFDADKVDGFVPVIINIMPIINIYNLVGAEEDEIPELSRL